MKVMLSCIFETVELHLIQCWCLWRAVGRSCLRQTVSRTRFRIYTWWFAGHLVCKEVLCTVRSWLCSRQLLPLYAGTLLVGKFHAWSLKSYLKHFCRIRQAYICLAWLTECEKSLINVVATAMKAGQHKSVHILSCHPCLRINENTIHVQCVLND